MVVLAAGGLLITDENIHPKRKASWQLIALLGYIAPDCKLWFVTVAGLEASQKGQLCVFQAMVSSVSVQSCRETNL